MSHSKRFLREQSLQEREYFVTIRAKDIPPGAEVVHRFQDARVVQTYCCGPSRTSAILKTVIIKVLSKGRPKFPGIRRVRTKAIDWSTLEREAIYVENC